MTYLRKRMESKCFRCNLEYIVETVVYGLMSKYDVGRVYIDGANPSFIKLTAIAD
jgi:hypothetical protein